MSYYENPPYYLSAYAIAVKHGYTGSEEEWINEIQETAKQASLAAAQSAETSETAKQAAETAKGDAEAAKGIAVDAADRAETARNTVEGIAASVSPRLDAQDAEIATIRSSVSNPFAVAASAAAMTDQTKAYVYAGSEDGYTTGGWYYYNGEAWTLGGTAVDPELAAPGTPAEAKATGEKVGKLKAESDSLSRVLFNRPLGRGNLYYGYLDPSTGSVNTENHKYAFINSIATGRYFEMSSDDYSYRVLYYNGSAASANFAGRAESFVPGTTRVYLNPKYATHIAINFRFAAGASTLSDADLVDIKSKREFYDHTLPDETLDTAGEPADSKSVGDRLLGIYEYLYTKRATPGHNLYGGGIDEETGAVYQSDDYAAYAEESAFFPDRLVYMDSDEFSYRLFYYDRQNNSYVYKGCTPGFVPGTTRTYLDPKVADRFKIVFRLTSGPADITDRYDDIFDALYVCAYEAPGQQDAVSTIVMRRNNPEHVQEIAQLAQNWYSHRNDTNSHDQKVMEYGYNGILTVSTYTREIDCSTFVGLLLRGYRFEDTSYSTEVPVAPLSLTGAGRYVWEINPYDWRNYLSANSSSVSRIRTAAQMGEWMVERGQRIIIDEYLANVEPGDILFFARKDEETGNWAQPNRFMRINHVAICVSKERVPQGTQDWDRTKYPWKHMFMEVGHEDPILLDGCVKHRVLEAPQNDTSDVYHNNINTLVLVCRPDLGSL